VDRTQDRAVGRQAVLVVAAREAVVALALPAGAAQRAGAAAARAGAGPHAALVLVAAVRLAGPAVATQQASGPVLPALAGLAVRLLAGHPAGVLAATHAKVVKPAGIGAGQIHAAAESETHAAKTALMAQVIVEPHRPLCGTQVPRIGLSLAEACAM